MAEQLRPSPDSPVVPAREQLVVATTHIHDDAHHHDAHRHGLSQLSAQAALSRRVHRLGRRGFLRDLGKGTLAVAIVGPALAACSSSTSVSASPTATHAPTPAPTAGSDDSPTPSPAPDDTGDSETEALEWAQVSLGNVSAYVLVRGNQAAVVDTGNPGSADQIASTLQALGVSWSDVQHVILTHSHNDHVGSVGDAVGRAPGAKLYAGAADIAAISAPVAIEVIETPGHTPGSISVIDHDAGLRIAGDALNGNAAGTDVLGANPRFSGDITTANESIRKLAGLRFDTAAFGHGNPFTGAADRAVASLADSL